jgi:hypothetical protein
MRLLIDALHERDAAYAVNWFWPNTLPYAIIAAGWVALSPALVGRFTLGVLVTLWVAAAFLVAWRRDRPLAAPILASVVAFNHALYWGFLSFFIGWPVFLVWLLAVDAGDSARGGRRDVARLAILSVLLYYAHVFWLLAGLGWLVLTETVRRDRPLIAALRLAALLPVVLMVTVWYPQLAGHRLAMGFDVGLHYWTSPLYRLQPGALRDATFGGLYGVVEGAFAVLIAAWIVLAVVTNFGPRGGRLDRMLFAGALLFFAVVLLAPDSYMSTILLWSRWMPCAVVLALLALPAPRLPARVLAAAALLAVLVFSVVTTAHWIAFEREELTGLDTALGEIAERSRVLGLDFVEDSAIVKDRPFMHLFAYAQVLRSATLNFSFAEHASGIVRYRVAPDARWSQGLEWRARGVKAEDLPHFDAVLANASEGVHAQLRARPELIAHGGSGRWRLYTVRHPAGREETPTTTGTGTLPGPSTRRP